MKKHPLHGLRSIGPAALKDFDLLGVTSQNVLAGRVPQELDDALCRLKGP